MRNTLPSFHPRPGNKRSTEYTKKFGLAMNPKCSLAHVITLYTILSFQRSLSFVFIFFFCGHMSTWKCGGGLRYICSAHWNLALHCSCAELESHKQQTQHLWHFFLMCRLCNVPSPTYVCMLLQASACARICMRGRDTKTQSDTFQQSRGGMRWHEAIHRIDYCVVKSAKAPEANSPNCTRQTPGSNE